MLAGHVDSDVQRKAEGVVELERNLAGRLRLQQIDSLSRAAQRRAGLPRSAVGVQVAGVQAPLDVLGAVGGEAQARRDERPAGGRGALVRRLVQPQQVRQRAARTVAALLRLGRDKSGVGGLDRAQEPPQQRHALLERLPEALLLGPNYAENRLALPFELGILVRHLLNDQHGETAKKGALDARFASEANRAAEDAAQHVAAPPRSRGSRHRR